MFNFCEYWNVVFVCGFLDIRDLISVNDVMDDDDMKLGPNGGLVFCME